jgi:hypothetical protein
MAIDLEAQIVVLRWHYTNTPVPPKDQVTAIIETSAIRLAPSNTVLLEGDGDR